MKRTLAIAALALAFIAGGTWLLNTRTMPDGTTQIVGGAALAQSEESSEAEAENTTEVPENEGGDESAENAEMDTSSIAEMTLGEEDAPVTVIEYASFTCPHCRDFHQNLYPELKSDYIDEGQVQLIYREVYFDLPGLWASMVARCGGEMRFFGLVNMIYDQQSEWVQGEGADIAENLRQMGLSAGLTQEQVDACFSDGEKAQTLLAWFEENREEDDVNSTPTFIINGEKFEGNWSSELMPAIDAALED
ncbi:DsbA family protein [Histidinibacterium aquaticum]|uniref:DsbA family protein n=1 Tax=Histidinibacterium aquaticum TaxID=2613962 RepID=A0A5J5GDS4_9RHOB|nr:DsbA family protein [Histidinibacterium aquaticum]KAA9005973.1 DsbA family protein [Histidinibacterium aquaticum]